MRVINFVKKSEYSFPRGIAFCFALLLAFFAANWIVDNAMYSVDNTTNLAKMLAMLCVIFTSLAVFTWVLDTLAFKLCDFIKAK